MPPPVLLQIAQIAQSDSVIVRLTKISSIRYYNMRYYPTFSHIPHFHQICYLFNTFLINVTYSTKGSHLLLIPQTLHNTQTQINHHMYINPQMMNKPQTLLIPHLLLFPHVLLLPTQYKTRLNIVSKTTFIKSQHSAIEQQYL